MSQDLEQFFTPKPITEALLDHVLIRGRVFEPCAGKGHIVRVLERSPHISRIYTNDVDERFPGLDSYEDATKVDVWDSLPPPGCDWTVTNPPFSLALPILRNAMTYTNNVALLLRITFLEPTLTRGLFLSLIEEDISHLIIFGSPRPSFTPDGNTDFATTMWIVWQRFRSNSGTQIRFITHWRQK